MIPRILSITAPLFVYVSLVVLGWALYRQRKKLDWFALIPALTGLAASFVFLEARHRLFYDEDIYIHIASNLSRVPIAQMTLLGGPDEILVSSYYKEPVGWPLCLSLVFLLTGATESAAFVASRLIYAIAIAAVYHLARELLPTRAQAFMAAAAFGSAPICFGFSVSPGTDIAAALFAALGMWGLASGNGALAAAGLALGASTRLELMILVPLLLVPKSILPRWKATGLALAGAALVHLLWVLSIAPVLARAEHAEAAFSLRFAVHNLGANLKYLLNPFAFPALLTIAALVAFRGKALNGVRPGVRFSILGGPAALLFVYLVFYAGSFSLNPRYAIQLLAPFSVLAAAVFRWPVLLVTLALPYLQPMKAPDDAMALAFDHQSAVEFASKLGTTDLIVTGEPEIFFNRGLHAMNNVYASERGDRLAEQFVKYRRVWYHAGIRTNLEKTQYWSADRWVKSNYQLHLIEGRDIRGMRISFYQILPKTVDREARLRTAFKCQSDSCKL
jgi:hypothetical protein